MKTLVLSVVLSFFSFSIFAKEIKEWTVLYYINYDNLNNAQVGSLLGRIENSRFDTDINVVMQADRGKAARYILTDNGNEKIQNLGVINSASSETILDFLNWATKTYPAKRYMLNFITTNRGGSGSNLGQDDSAKVKMNLVALAQTLRDFSIQLPNKKFDVISVLLPTYGYYSGYSADLMFMMEFLGVAEVFVGTPYNIGTSDTEEVQTTTLNVLSDNKDKSTREIAKVMGEPFRETQYKSSFNIVDLNNLERFWREADTLIVDSLSGHGACMKSSHRPDRGVFKLGEFFWNWRECIKRDKELMIRYERLMLSFGTQPYYSDGSCEDEKSCIKITRSVPGKVRYVVSESEVGEVDLILGEDGITYEATISYEKFSPFGFQVKLNFGTSDSPLWILEAVTIARPDYGFNYPESSPVIVNGGRGGPFDKMNFMALSASDMFNHAYDEVDKMQIKRVMPNMYKFIRGNLDQ